MSFNTFDRGIFYAPSDGGRRYQNRMDVKPGMISAPKATFEEVIHNGLRLSLIEYENRVIEPQKYKWPQAAWTLDLEKYAETLGFDADRMREFRLKLEYEDIIKPLKLHELSYIRTVMGYYDQPRARALAAIRFWTQDIEDYRNADLTEKIISLKEALGKNPVNDYIHLPEEDRDMRTAVPVQANVSEAASAVNTVEAFLERIAPPEHIVAEGSSFRGSVDVLRAPSILERVAQAAREYDYSGVADPVMREHMQTYVERRITDRKEEDWPILASQLGRIFFSRDMFLMEYEQARKFYHEVRDNNSICFMVIEKGGQRSSGVLHAVVDRDRMRALAALAVVYKRHVKSGGSSQAKMPFHTIVSETKQLLGEGHPLAQLLRYPSSLERQPAAPRKTSLPPISPVIAPGTVFQQQIGLSQHFSDMIQEQVNILNGYKLDDLKKLFTIWGRGHAAIDVSSEFGYRDAVRVVYALDSLRKALVARKTPDFSMPLGTIPVADLLPKLKAAILFMEQNNIPDLGKVHKLILKKTSGK